MEDVGRQVHEGFRVADLVPIRPWVAACFNPQWPNLISTVA